MSEVIWLEIHWEEICYRKPDNGDLQGNVDPYVFSGWVLSVTLFCQLRETKFAGQLLVFYWKADSIYPAFAVSWAFFTQLNSFMLAVRSKSICNLDLKSLDNRFRVGYFCGSGLWQALHSKLLVWIQVTIVDRVRYVACIWLATWYLMGFALPRHCPTVLYC